MANRTKRACQVCGRPFEGSTDCYYCPDCAKEKKLDTVVRDRICKDCGVTFLGGPRASRCPNCAHKALQETSRNHKKNGSKRPLGSIDTCAICGKEYTVVSGRQKYCPNKECRRIGVLAWQKEHKNGYAKASGQDVKKRERRKKSQKICIYCLRTFSSNSSTNFCSDYCRSEQKKLTQCISDINRGYKRNLKKYEEKRERYREMNRN